MGGDESFYFETFNNENDSADANVLALQTTNLDPTTSLIFTTMEEVVFDSSCSNDHPNPNNNDDNDDDDAAGSCLPCSEGEFCNFDIEIT